MSRTVERTSDDPFIALYDRLTSIAASDLHILSRSKQFNPVEKVRLTDCAEVWLGVGLSPHCCLLS